MKSGRHPRKRKALIDGLPLPSETEEWRTLGDLVGEVRRQRTPAAREHGCRGRHEDGAGWRAPVPEGARGSRGNRPADPSARGPDPVAADLRQHYEATGSRDLEEADYRLEHLKAFFSGRRAAAIGQAEATAYVIKRQGEQASGATINRELAVLIRMLRLAYENGKLPPAAGSPEAQGGGASLRVFEREQYEAVRRHLPVDLQVAVAIAYTYGWRMQSEVLALERRQLDLEAGTLRLDPGTTKNDEGRLVYLTPEIKALLASQLERVEALPEAHRADHPVPLPVSHRPAPTGTPPQRFPEGVGAYGTISAVPWSTPACPSASR